MVQTAILAQGSSQVLETGHLLSPVAVHANICTGAVRANQLTNALNISTAISEVNS